MAKSTKKPAGGAIDAVSPDVLKKARDLLTGPEKRLFDSSLGTALAKHTLAQVQSAVKQARSLRDKWRDLAQAQGRSVKRSGRRTDQANARTHAKRDILADVVTRFERRLAELRQLVTTAGAPARPATGRPAAAKTGAARKSAAASPAKKAVRPTAASKKASRRVTSGLDEAPASQLVRFNRTKQQSAIAAAKASRILRGGQGTQRLSHVAASGRRAQRRRDIRSRG